jgi:hypothetical protein
MPHCIGVFTPTSRTRLRRAADAIAPPADMAAVTVCTTVSVVPSVPVALHEPRANRWFAEGIASCRPRASGGTFSAFTTLMILALAWAPTAREETPTRRCPSWPMRLSRDQTRAGVETAIEFRRSRLAPVALRSKLRLLTRPSAALQLYCSLCPAHRRSSIATLEDSPSLCVYHPSRGRDLERPFYFAATSPIESKAHQDRGALTWERSPTS